MKNLSDKEIMAKLDISESTLKRFKEIKNQTISEAKKRYSKKNNIIKVLGISGSARDKYDMAAEDSNSEMLLNQSLAKFKSLGAKTEIIQLRKFDMKPCKACYSTTNCQCHFYCSCYPKGTKLADDISNILYDKVLDADIIIFATPTNNFKMSSMMSIFIDRLISLDGSLPPADPSAKKNKELNIKHTQFVEMMADNKIPGSGFLKRFLGKVAGIIVTGHEEGASMVISSLFMTLNHFGMAFSPMATLYATSSVLNPTFKDKKILSQKPYFLETEMMAENCYNLAKILNIKPNKWLYDQSMN